MYNVVLRCIKVEKKCCNRSYYSETSLNGPPTGPVKYGHFREVVNLQRCFYMFHKYLGYRNKGPKYQKWLSYRGGRFRRFYCTCDCICIILLTWINYKFVQKYFYPQDLVRFCAYHGFLWLDNEYTDKLSLSVLNYCIILICFNILWYLLYRNLLRYTSYNNLRILIMFLLRIHYWCDLFSHLYQISTVNEL